MTRVSVIMAAYNCRDHIDRAIDSLVAQTMPDWELIVVDDASSDDTAARVQGRAKDDPRIRLLIQPLNQGPSAARNRAIDQAISPWITILDADDAYQPRRLERLLASAETSGADFIADNQQQYDDSAKLVTGVAFPESIPPHAIGLRDLLESERPGSTFKLGFLKPMIRASLLSEYKLRYREDLRLAEDFYLYAELFARGVVGHLIPDALYIYTLPFGALTGVKSSATRTNFVPETRVRIADDLIAAYADQLDGASRASLHRYRSWMKCLATAYRIREAGQQGRYASAFFNALIHPRATFHWLWTR